MNHVQVNLRGLPSSVLDAVLRPENVQNIRPPENTISPLTFPKSKLHLWDSTPNGDHVSLHLAFYRNPRLLLMEKALRLAHRHARQSGSPHFVCFFIGMLAVDDDEEGVTLTLDRFDPGREQPGCPGKTPTALLPGDVLVPCVLQSQHATAGTVYSAEDFDASFKMLQHYCSSRETLELSKLLTLRARLTCTENMDRLSFTLQWAAVTLSSSLEAVPVSPVPVIPTALVRALTGPASVAQPLHAVTRRRGFLTMDQTRKLLLMLESDPKVYTLPLVGVWLSGVTHLHSPAVWAWCLRYLYSSSLQDRVMSESGAFLLVLYSLTHRDPEFYQCRLQGNPKDISFQLLVRTESLTLYKNVEPSEGRYLQFELGADGQSEESKLFKDVLNQSALARCAGAASSTAQNKLSVSDHDSGVEDEDLSPRPSPNPHPLNQQTRQVQPSVPELSMVLDGSFIDGKLMESHDCSIPQPAQSGPQQRSSTAQVHHRAPHAPVQSCTTGPPPIKRPLTPVLSQPVTGRAPSSTAQHGPKPSSNRKNTASMNTARRSSNVSSASSSSSSSSSSSRTAPKDPFQQRGQRPGHNYTTAPHPHASPVLSSPLPPPPSSSSSSSSSAAGHSGSRNPNALPEQTPLPCPPQHTHHFHSTPAFAPCNCCPTHHAHPPVYSNAAWHDSSMPPAPSGNPVPCPSEGSPHRDCCPSGHTPVYQSAPWQGSPLPPAPVHMPSEGSPHSAHADVLPARLTPTRPVCQAQCCRIQPTHTVQPNGFPAGPQEGSVEILPADAYRMLMDQDRQLKLLQAQIQKLLEAQSKASEPTQAPADLPEEQSIRTSLFTEPQKKTCVSIAVGTGASLFWRDPGEGAMPEDDLRVEGHAEAPWQSGGVDGSTVSSRVSSEDVQRCRGDESPATPLHSTRSLDNASSLMEGSFQSPVLGESASMYYRTRTPDETDEGREMHDQRFYQELLGQVNSRLQDCVTEEEVEPDGHVVLPRKSLSPKTSPQNKPNTPKTQAPKERAAVSQQDHVLSATLKQLHQLGVSVELDTHLGKGKRATVESASTLACINPAAVVPQLALCESVGTSVWGSGGGVDLSLEANAIALKYLSDSQLSRLSLGGQTPAARANPGAVIFGKTPLDKSSVGLSLLSPSNMSLATCTYMKKYGLIEGGSGVEEEEEDDDEEGGDEEKATSRAQRLHMDSALGCSLQHEPSENVGHNETDCILRNVSNQPPLPPPPAVTAPLYSQSQLIRDLRPKMQLLTGTKVSSEIQRRGPLLDTRGPGAPQNQTESSVGNFLDLSRLRQLPKLF